MIIWSELYWYWKFLLPLWEKTRMRVLLCWFIDLKRTYERSLLIKNYYFKHSNISWFVKHCLSGKMSSEYQSMSWLLYKLTWVFVLLNHTRWFYRVASPTQIYLNFEYKMWQCKFFSLMNYLLSNAINFIIYKTSPHLEII